MPEKSLGGRVTALSAACLVALAPFAMSSAAAMPVSLQTTVHDVQQQPSGLVVTEILPDTTGYDHYEYFEIHNASDEAINLTKPVTALPTAMRIRPTRVAMSH